MRKIDWRHWASFGILVFFLALNTATSKAPSGPYPYPIVTGEAGADAAAETSTTTASIDARAPLADVDTKTVCAGSKSALCRVLGDFKKGTTPTDLPVTGQEIWVGVTYVEGTAVSKLPWFVKLQRGYTPSPLKKYEPDVMEVSAVDGSFRTETAPDFQPFIDAVQAGKPEPSPSRAADFVRSYSPTDYFPLVHTDGISIAMLEKKRQVFLRTNGNRLIAVEYQGGTMITHDKIDAPIWVSELWKVK